MIKAFYYLAKPGIIYGNAITAIAGFLLASREEFNAGLFVAMLAGISLVMAGGCVFNNIFDKDIDAKMDRTKNRALVTGKISQTGAFVYGLVLVLLGVMVLYFYTNNVALAAALAGFIFYVGFYTPFKRRTVYGTLIGAVAGAVPPVVGYAAVTNAIVPGAVILFFILVFWQMPHFYAIAMYRLKDYTAAAIPALPVKKGVMRTKVEMILYIIAFTVVAIMLSVYGLTGIFYTVVAVIFGLAWLWYAIQGFKAVDNILWAKKMFRFSLIVLTVLSIMMMVNAFVP